MLLSVAGMVLHGVVEFKIEKIGKRRELHSLNWTSFYYQRKRTKRMPWVEQHIFVVAWDGCFHLSDEQNILLGLIVQFGGQSSCLC